MEQNNTVESAEQFYPQAHELIERVFDGFDSKGKSSLLIDRDLLARVIAVQMRNAEAYARELREENERLESLNKTYFKHMGEALIKCGELRGKLSEHALGIELLRNQRDYAMSELTDLRAKLDKYEKSLQS